MKSLLEFVGEVVDVLDQNSVQYMITGSVASTYYAEPRTTIDLDVVVAAPLESIQAFAASFAPDRFYVGDATRAAETRDQFNVIDLESTWKLDVVVQKDRPFSRSEFDRRIEVDLFGRSVFIATVEDMILSKLEWAKLGESERQVRDVAIMIAVNRDQLDIEYLRHWADELGVLDVLNRELGNDSL